VAEGLTTALDLKDPKISDLRGKDAQMVLTLKVTYIISLFGAT
jgi:hypothetical protein